MNKKYNKSLKPIVTSAMKKETYKRSNVSKTLEYYDHFILRDDEDIGKYSKRLFEGENTYTEKKNIIVKITTFVFNSVHISVINLLWFKKGVILNGNWITKRG